MTESNHQLKSLSYDSWLSRVLGRSAYKSSGTDFDSLESDLTKLPSKSFVWAKVDCKDTASLSKHLNLNFEVVDTNVVFEKRITSRTSKDCFDVRSAKDSDKVSVLKIAETAFRYSRFHLDTKFESTIGAAVKRAWVESYFNGTRGDRMMIAEHEGVVSGFLLIVDVGLKACLIDLIGVSPQAQGKGIGRALIGQLEDQMQEGTISVGTQIANIQSIRFYEKLGFSMISATYVVHRHLK